FQTATCNVASSRSLHDALPICYDYGCGAPLEDAGLFLQPPDVCDDLGEIVPGDARNLRHVAERPVMGAHSHFCGAIKGHVRVVRSEEHTSELQSRVDLVCRLLL